MDSVEVLENLLLRMEWSARDYLEHEFAFVNREWYAGASPDQQYKGIAEFFNSNHSMDAADLLQEALDDVARRDVGLSMPNGPQVATILNEMQFMSCIVHGDLNAGNILCAQSRERHCGDERDTASTLRTVLIDYRHTCRGPVFVDFAALHASLRLLPAEVDKEMMNIDELLAWERRVWLDTWGKDREWSPGPEYGYAKGLALRLGQLARINFEGGATPERGMLIEGRAKFEYAATCLLYALRLYKLRGLGRDLVSDNGGFKDLRDNCRLRLGIWVHMLATVLESGRLD